MKVVGVVGRIGSGKDETVEYLHERCGVPLFSIGDIVRERAEREGVTPTRENLHELTERIMQRHGDDIFVRRLIERIVEVEAEVVGIAGIRRPEEVAVLRDHFGDDLLLVHVEVNDPRTRYRRLDERDEPRDPDTYEAFLAQDRQEEDLFRISEAIAHADVTLNNDGSLDALHRQVEQVLIRDLLADVVRCGPRREALDEDAR
jgi:dephospho-CoA kinase